MSTLEIFATIFTVLCVILAVKRSTWQYPVGLIGTILYYFVFQQVQLYASAGLQIFFLLVQLYGWWFWLYGDAGKKPKITTLQTSTLVCILVIGLIVSILAGSILNHFTNANMAKLDASIFGFSVIAQFLLDRKKIETWIVWAIVNVVSIFVYFGQGLVLTGWLYVFLLINTVWGYIEWKKNFNKNP
jgi:nicotinamide mononucleotide transporter